MKLNLIILLFLLCLILTTAGAIMKVNSYSEANYFLSAGMLSGALALILASLKVLFNKKE